MEFWQEIIISFFGINGLLFFLKSFHQVKNKKNVYGLTPYLFFLGAFVWGDVTVLGPFWIIASLVSLFLKNWYLFLLIVSLFWTIRSMGETIYWLNEQFAGKNRNPPHTLNFHKFFGGEAVWFIYQLFWQCILVFSILLSMYFAKIWLISVK